MRKFLSLAFGFLFVVWAFNPLKSQTLSCAEKYTEPIKRLLAGDDPYRLQKAYVLCKQADHECGGAATFSPAMKALTDSVYGIVLHTRNSRYKDHQEGLVAISDTDNDGVPDEKDRCPYRSGPQSQGGCPTSTGAKYKWVTKTSVDGGIYTGEYFNNQPNGMGQLVAYDGSTSTGYFVNGRLDGRGKKTIMNGTADSTTYIGVFTKGEMNGTIRVYDKEKKQLSKSWYERGKLIKSDPPLGLAQIMVDTVLSEGRYVGMIGVKERIPDGRGKYQYENATYEGYFQFGLSAGWGKTIAGDRSGEGEYDYGVSNGFTIFITPKTKLIGQFHNDYAEGKAVLYSAKDFEEIRGGRIYAGDFANRRSDGFARCYNAEGALVYEGIFRAGYPVDKSFTF